MCTLPACFVRPYQHSAPTLIAFCWVAWRLRQDAQGTQPLYVCAVMLVLVQRLRLPQIYTSTRSVQQASSSGGCYTRSVLVQTPMLVYRPAEQVVL